MYKYVIYLPFFIYVYRQNAGYSLVFNEHSCIYTYMYKYIIYLPFFICVYRQNAGYSLMFNVHSCIYTYMYKYMIYLPFLIYVYRQNAGYSLMFNVEKVATGLRYGVEIKDRKTMLKVPCVEKLSTSDLTNCRPT